MDYRDQNRLKLFAELKAGAESRKDLCTGNNRGGHYFVKDHLGNIWQCNKCPEQRNPDGSPV